VITVYVVYANLKLIGRGQNHRPAEKQVDEKAADVMRQLITVTHMMAAFPMCCKFSSN